MIEVKSRLKSSADREKWAARGASFVAKAKATKMVWFPPKSVETGKKTASTAKKATKRATRKTASTAKKSTAADKKSTNGTKKVTNPLRRNA